MNGVIFTITVDYLKETGFKFYDILLKILILLLFFKQYLSYAAKDGSIGITFMKYIIFNN